MISVKGLSKTYENGTVALSAASFDVDQGEIFAFIGPNGAGKTTTIRILVTLMEPTDGTASICGRDVIRYPDQVRHLLGFMPDDFGVYAGLYVWEYLDFFAAAYGMSRPVRRRAVNDVLDLTDMGPLRERMVEGLSKGMRQRLCLAKTLIHDPQVLILDEPAAGLDPRARIEFRALLQILAERGKTILISSHILSELREICTSCCIIEQGRILASGNIDDMTEELLPVRIGLFKILGSAQQAAQLLENLNGVVSASADGHKVRVEFNDKTIDVQALAKHLIEKQVSVVGIEEKERDMEALFLRVTKGKLA
jgi:ABC-2 type transport system ATP-binding protein